MLLRTPHTMLLRPTWIRPTLLLPSRTNSFFAPARATKAAKATGYTPASVLLRSLSTNTAKSTIASQVAEKPTVIVEPQAIFTPEERALAAQARLDGLGPYVSKLPAKYIPYAELMRLEKPVGTWLLYLPCTWSILLAATETAAPISSTLFMMSVFGIGSLIMRGFGCTINDLLDRDFDNKVIRTIERPIASGRVTPNQAITFLGGQLLVGLAIILSLPFDCFVLGALSLLPVCTYPLFKRFTYYPQAVLAIAFNWGALLGFPAMEIWDVSTMVPLFLSSFMWTMTYDTVYAHQDKAFDVAAGVKSTALAWGDHSKKVFTGLTLTQFAMLAAAGVSSGSIMMPGFVVGGSIFAYKMSQMIRKVDLNDPKSCWKYFTNNINYGLYFTYGLVFDYLLKVFGLW